ncbi:MAG: sugar transferase [Actinomycetota bacterium]
MAGTTPIWKRAIDLGFVALTAPIVVPVALAIAIAVALTSRGPVLFRQERAGHLGEPYTTLKFRTMLDGDNPLIPSDDRITAVGRVLRRTSLDELPQLINVLRGEMSVVGPRPMLVAQAAVCDEAQRRRFDSLPGLTGWAQINGRNSLAWAERIDLDTWYVDNRSPLLDLRIMVRTPLAMASGDGIDGHPVDDPFVARLTQDASDA